MSYVGCPRIVRADHGTENCVVAKVHIGFRMNHRMIWQVQEVFFMDHQLLIQLVNIDVLWQLIIISL